MPTKLPIEISRWARTDPWKLKPSVYELIRLHHALHRRDKFAQVMYAYPFAKDTMAKTIKELIPRKDYEFFLARVQPSNEIVGWIALSFDIEGNEAENRDEYEAKLEWTEMCSHILKEWKVGSAGAKSNIWDTIKRASSSLQAKHLPRNYCIINTLVLYPQMQKAGIATALLEYAIEFWKNRVRVGTEWAMWVQAPYFTQNLYKKCGFEEVGEYETDLGDYGFLPMEERVISGKYAWKFMVLREESGSATEEHGGVQKLDKGKSKEQPLEDVEEYDAAWKLHKSKGKQHRPDDVQLDEEYRSEHDAERTRAWEDAEQRLEDIRARRGPPPLPGEVACLTRIQRKAEDRGPDTTGLSKGKGVEQGLEDVRFAPSGESLTRLLQCNAEVTGQPQDNYRPTKSDEDLIETMRMQDADEEDIELVKALAFSLSDETKGG